MHFIRNEKLIAKIAITFLAICALLFTVMTGCSTILRTEVTPSVLQSASSLPEYTSVPNDSYSTADTLTTAVSLKEDGVYTSKDDVALYIHLYSKLPGNFISKKQASQLGWSGGSLEQYAPGKCIGGDKFGNYEGMLPSKNGRVYTECDIDTLDATSRGTKRIVFSNDGLVYYTDDHYESFTLLYGDDST